MDQKRGHAAASTSPSLFLCLVGQLQDASALHVMTTEALLGMYTPTPKRQRKNVTTTTTHAWLLY